MRFARFFTISALLSLGCGDSSGLGSLPCRNFSGIPDLTRCSPQQIGLEGPAFMRARIDTSLFSLSENDALVWHFDGTTLDITGLPATASAAGFAYIDIQVRYLGPGTYTLGATSNPEGVAFYGVFAGDPLEPVASYQTLGDHTGTLHISAIDMTLGVVAGTFEFSAVRNDAGAGEVHVTEGSFRARTRPQ